MRVAASLILPFWLGLLGACATSPVKGEPEPVLHEGKQLLEKKEYRQAQRYFRGVTKYHPDSDEAEEALFLQAECKRYRRKGSPAFEDYKKFVEKYPNSRFSVGVALGEYQLGMDHMNGKIPGFLFLKADTGYSVTILEHMQLHFRNHSLADDALVQIASYQLKKGDNDAATRTLERLLAEYPRSEHMLWARFQLGRSLWEQNQGALYDERLLLRSRRAFEDYAGTAKLLGQAERQKEQVEKAREMIKRIDDRRAEKEYRIGRFYERRKYPLSAAYYYRHCMRTFPGTQYAAESQKRLEELRPRLAQPRGEPEPANEPGKEK